MSGILNNIKKEFYGNAQISIMDNSNMKIENCSNILECNENLVRLNACDFEVSVWGDSLVFSNYSSRTIIVHGNIQSVELIERSRRK